MALNLRAVLSDRCNYSCVFCSRDFNRTCNADIPAEFLETCIKAFASLGGRKVTYTGGEPLMYPELYGAMRLVHSLGMENSITTNGSLLEFQDAEFFALIDALNISVPSFNPEEYTRLTGGTSLEDVKRNAVKCASLGLKVKINCVYTEGRELMIDEMINFFSPHGIIIKVMNDMLAGEKYYSEFMKFASRFSGDDRIETECALNPGYDFCRSCNIPRASSCPSCRSVRVYPYGRITLCPFDNTGSFLRWIIMKSRNIEASAGSIAMQKEYLADQPGPMQSRYDSALVEGQWQLSDMQKNHAEMLRALDLLKGIESAEGNGVITAGSVVLVKQNGKINGYLLLDAKGGAGASVVHEGIKYTIITPQSPLGMAITGKKAGDSAELKTSRRMTCTIEEVM